MNNAMEYLGKEVQIDVDRPLGSKHPKFGFVYPLNYGLVPHTVSGDGEELDAYLLGVEEPVETFVGTCIAVIHRTNDDDDKLVVAPSTETYTEEEIREATDFQEKWFKSVILFP